MNKIKTIILGTINMLSAAVAYASEGAAEGGHDTITFMGDWLPRLVNFGIIAFVVVYYLRKPAADFFKSRTAEIARSLEESKVARERAAQALAEMDRKMKDLEAETARMIDDAKTRGEKDKQTLIEDGRKVAAEVQIQVKAGIEIEVQKARTGLAAEAALLAVELAEGSIKKNISKQDHERILKDYITKVGGRG